MDFDDTSQHVTDGAGIDRRRALRNALIGTSFGAVLLGGHEATAEAAGKKKRTGKTVKFDVACRGSTFRNQA